MSGLRPPMRWCGVTAKVPAALSGLRPPMLGVESRLKPRCVALRCAAMHRVVIHKQQECCVDAR
eukprot:358289-Chlamydomonas_euryale.AAC.1